MAMMNPASSSGSDDDSSTSSRSSREGELYRAQRRADIEPVDSSDEGSSDDGEYHYDGASHHDLHEQQPHHTELTNFDDLPTDDSEDDSDSDSDSDDGSADSTDEKQRAVGKSDSDDDSSIEEEEGIPEEDVPLSERVATKAREGRRYYTGEDHNNDNNNNNGLFDDSGKKRRAERKSKAIELASERLKEVRKGKTKKEKQQYSISNYSSDDDDDGSSIEQATSTGTVAKTSKKKSKHAPTEISSKRRDYFARGRPDLNSSGIGVSIGANKYKARDPRMVSLSGHLDADIFEKRYGFLDEVQEQEIDALKKRVNAWKTSGKKGQRARKKLGITNGNGSLEDDQEELKRLLQERAERKRANVVRAAKKSVKQKIRQDVASGKRGAYYPKRSELKRMEAEAKYTEIRKRGGDEAVDKAIAKRRKKNMSKEAKSMPNI